jgi:Cytochrome c554 and c-prime
VRQRGRNGHQSRFSFLCATARVAGFAGLAGVLAAGAALAQDFQGPARCTACHDHARETQKWQRDEPAALPGQAHFGALKRLDGARAAGFAKAIGLADPRDARGACVKCHATVYGGNASAGVSCESCHGASSAYVDRHQDRGAYLEAVAAGMRDLRGRPAAIARLCLGCHVTSDARLARAGHPTGSDFDAGLSLQKLVHWNARYDAAAVTAAVRSAAATPTEQASIEEDAAGSRLARLAALRGRALRALERQLRTGQRDPELAAPTPPAEFGGPDSELLRLQDEVLALGIEALRRPR